MKQKETLSGSGFYLLLVIYSAGSQWIFLIQTNKGKKIWYTYKNTLRVVAKWYAQMKWMNLSLHKKKCLTYKQLSNITTAESLYLTEFTYKALSACKLDTVNSITNQLFGIKNIFSSGKNVINGNYLPRQEHKRLLNVYCNEKCKGNAWYDIRN